MQRPANWPRKQFLAALIYFRRVLPGGIVRIEEEGHLSCHRSSPTDEGWRSVTYTAEPDEERPGRLLVTSYVAQRDCDGRYEDEDVYSLAPRRKARRIYVYSTAYSRSIGKRPGPADYRRYDRAHVSDFRRDHSAEAAGY